jgi:hypothetical protein
VTQLNARTVGPWFETQVHGALKDFASGYNGVSHRFMDTRAAAQVVRNAPSDFLLLHESAAHLIECKASLDHESFSQCLSHLQDHQAASLTQWVKAGGQSWVFYYSDYLGAVEIWDGGLVARCRMERKRLSVEARATRAHIDSLLPLLTEIL